MDKSSMMVYDVAVIDKVLSDLDRVTTTGVSSSTKLLEAYTLLNTAGKVVQPNKEEEHGDDSSSS